jgi:hypothetical protein
MRYVQEESLHTMWSESTAVLELVIVELGSKKLYAKYSVGYVVKKKNLEKKKRKIL